MHPDDPNQPKTNRQVEQDTADAAANVIRSKLDSLYAEEPDTKEEIVDAEEAGRHRTKHQDFMYKLSTSGKSLAEIQTQWHNYYTNLPDKEKHEVWQEFYEEHGRAPHFAKSTPAHNEAPKEEAPPAQHHKTHQRKPIKPRSIADVKEQIASKVGTRGKLSKKHHLQSIVFGLGMGAVVLFILMFSFFNDRIIAPFISPSRDVSNTPIIVDQNSTAVNNDPKVIIPKINVEIPVVYDVPSIDEQSVDNGLERGVVHYASTPSPGEQGNVVVVGHSSNNIFNKGKYKFAFVLLKKLEVGDTFMLDKDGKQYVYRVYDKKIVKPTDVSVLGPADKPSTATLITCDPPGTSLNRLVVTGEQISPDPGANVTSTVVNNNQKPAIVPGNAESLWQRFKNWITG